MKKIREKVDKYDVVLVFLVALLLVLGGVTAFDREGPEDPPPAPDTTDWPDYVLNPDSDEPRPAAVVITIMSDGIVFHSEDIVVDSPEGIEASIINGDCSQPPEMFFIGNQRDLSLNEVTTEILVVVDELQVCWFTWGTWPGNGQNAESAFFVDSVVYLVGDYGSRTLMYDPENYYSEAIPNYPNGTPQYYWDSFKMGPGEYGDEYEIRIYAYQKQIIPGEPSSSWPGLAIDASLYPRNPNRWHYLTLIWNPTGKTTCPTACMQGDQIWGVSGDYRNDHRYVQAGASTDGSAVNGLGHYNVTYPDCARFAWILGSDNPANEAVPPTTGYYWELWKREGNSWTKVEDFVYWTQAAVDGNVCINCSHLDYSTNEFQGKTGFYIEVPGCPKIYCRVRMTLKDPPPYIALALGLSILLFFGFVGYIIRRKMTKKELEEFNSAIGW